MFRRCYVVLAIVLLTGCSKTSPTRPADPKSPAPSTFDTVLVEAYVSGGAIWIAQTVDTNVVLGAQNEWQKVAVIFDKRRPLALSLGCFAIVADTLRCIAGTWTYPPQDSIPVGSTDPKLRVPDIISASGP